MDSSSLSILELFGGNVQKYRKKNNLTQVELSEKLGVSQKHLSDIETGTKFPSAALIEKLSKELCVEPSLLFGGSDSIEISNRVVELIMANLQPKLDSIFNELRIMKTMMQNMKITVQPEDRTDNF